jgi:hypothetical protein
MKQRTSIFILAMCSVFLFNACKKNPPKPQKAESVKLKFNFEHLVNATPLVTNSIQYTNAAGNPFSVQNLRYFISDVTIYSAGNAFKIDDEHYIDIENITTFNYSPAQQFTNAIYDSISFTFGLNATKNINGHFVNPPESNMTWPTPMGGGFHYMQLEGKFDSATVTKNYAFHTGPSGGNQFFFNVSLPNSSFTADGTDIEVSIAMNIEKWFETPNIYDFNQHKASIMGDTATQRLIQQNGHDVFSIIAIK